MKVVICDTCRPNRSVLNITPVMNPLLTNCNSRAGNGATDTLSTLPGVEVGLLAADDGWRLLNDLLPLRKNHLDMAWVRHIRVNLYLRCQVLSYRTKYLRTYPSVGTIGASPLFRGLVDLNVPDNEVAGVEAFGVRVRFRVLEKTEKEFGGLDRPPRLRDTELLACKIIILAAVCSLYTIRSI